MAEVESLSRDILETPASRNRGLVYKGFSAAGLAWNRTCEVADRGFEDSTPATLLQIAWYLAQWREHNRTNGGDIVASSENCL